MLRSRRTSSIGSLRPAQCWRLSWLSATFGAHALPQQLNALQRLRPVLPVRKAHHDVLEPVVAPMRRDERSRPTSRSARVVRARTSTLRVHAHSPRLALQKGAPSVVALLHEVQRGAAARGEVGSRLPIEKPPPLSLFQSVVTTVTSHAPLRAKSSSRAPATVTVLRCNYVTWVKSKIGQAVLPSCCQ